MEIPYVSNCFALEYVRLHLPLNLNIFVLFSFFLEASNKEKEHIAHLTIQSRTPRVSDSAGLPVEKLLRKAYLEPEEAPADFLFFI